MPKKEVKLGTIKDVFFYYSRLNTPTLTKSAKDKGVKGVGENGENGEYVTKIAVGDSVYKKLKKAYKGAKNFPNVKEYDLKEFKAAFHEDGGMPDFGDDTDVVLIKFAQKSFNDKSGKPMQAPKLIAINKVGKVYKDNNGLLVEQDTLLGNGTKGHLQFRPVDFGEYGVYLYPNAVCVTDVIEYEGSDGGEVDEDAFGIQESDAEEEEQEEEESFDDEFDDDLSF